MPTCDNKIDVRRGVFEFVLMLFVALLVGCQSQRIRALEPQMVVTGSQQESPLVPADAKRWYLRAMVAEGRGDLVEAERSLLWALRLDRHSEWIQQACQQFYARHEDLDRDACDH